MLIQSCVSTRPRFLLFCHILQAESRFFTLAFTFPLNWNVTVATEKLSFIEGIFYHFMLINCWPLYTVCITLHETIQFHHFFQDFSLLFCSSPFTFVFSIIPASHRGFFASFLPASVCWPRISFAFVCNVVTFVHYPGCWLPAALFCDLTAAFLRMGPFTWAAEHR